MDLFTHLTPHTTVLTPNRRLAAVLLKNYTHYQLTQKQSCWKTLDVLPLYPTWLERLWQTYSAYDFAVDSLLLTTSQEDILWEKILHESGENEHLLHLSDTAKLAKSAWETLKRWMVPLTDNQLHLTDDSRAFLKWAIQFKEICQKNNWIDQHSLADLVALNIQNKKIASPKHLLLVGFTEINPQYQHLLKIMSEQGTRITHHQFQTRNQTVQRIGVADIETEIRTMARFAKSRLATSTAIGCVIPNLEDQRELILSVFLELLEPNHFNISAGKCLITYPIIKAALQLLQLNVYNIKFNDISQILRTPFIGEAESEQYQRAQFENHLRNENISTLSFKELLNPEGKYALFPTCPALATRLKNFFNAQIKKNKLLSINEWITHWRNGLHLLGWPGERSVNSHEFQVIQNCWLPLLNEYATFDTILSPQCLQTALQYLICLTANKVFQPESPEAPIQILGLLEAADIPFEHTWVMGLDDTAWPSQPKPNPFIPLRLQKSLNMPNASAERELIYCRELTQQLKQSSDHVIMSYALKRDDTELRPSALLKNIPDITIDQLLLEVDIPIAETIFLTQQLDWFQDQRAERIISSVSAIQGGVSIFKKQAECPFKAFAELRLHAQKMEDTSIGIRPQDRGNMVHKALELIWNELKDWSQLILKSDNELSSIIQRHAKKALFSIANVRVKKQSRYLQLEQQRLEKLLWNWLQLEKSRPAFKVVSHEQRITITLGQLTTTLRVDRIDELSDGSQLIIDYKTGKNNDHKKFFSPRPDEPQLPLYCIVNTGNTMGIAFAEVHPFSMNIIGASREPTQIKSIKLLTEIKQADATQWDTQKQLWQQHLTQLGNDFYEGKADIDPKNSNLTCRQCHLQALCRIHEVNHDELVDEDVNE